MKKMSRDEVCAWVKNIGLEAYAKTFHEYGVDGSMLEFITDEVLKTELHVDKLLHRKKILAEIGELKKKPDLIYVLFIFNK